LRVKNASDNEAWKEFVARYAPKIYGWCEAKGLHEQDRQDVTQEVLYRLVTLMRQFEYHPSKGKFRSWLWTVWQSALSDLYARVRLVAAGGSAIADLLNNQEARSDLEQRLKAEFDLELLEEAEFRVRSQVSDFAWQAYVLHEKEGLPIATIEERLEKSVPAVKMACLRVRKLLKTELQNLDGDDLSG
jgi:RNA polymerase sigma-70 factor (ECF subfamily)